MGVSTIILPYYCILYIILAIKHIANYNLTIRGTRFALFYLYYLYYQYL